MAAMVAACFKDVLGAETVGPQDNFFELGGESLMMLDVIDLIRQRSGISVPAADAFKALTVADMTRLCEAQAARLSVSSGSVAVRDSTFSEASRGAL